MKRTLLLLLLFPISVFAQSVNKPFITVEGEVLKPLRLTNDDLANLKEIELKAKDKDGKEHTYKGVRLFDILDSSGVTLGKDFN